MRTRFIGFIIPLALILTSCRQSAVVENPAFDAHNLTGIWVPESREGTLNTISNNRPPMTTWGQEKFAAVRADHDGKHLMNAVGQAPQKEWNDPTIQCDPVGYPRIMFQPYGRVMRFVQTSNEMLQFFEWNHTWRDIWTDGRKPLEDPDPTYFGYGVGRWEGDTFVVESYGFNDRTWTDMYGSPHSEEMRLQERFRRVSPDRMEWNLTLIDPKTYTQPWDSGPMTLTLHAKSPRSANEELREDFCVWTDMSRYFSKINSMGLGDSTARLPENR